MLTEGVLHVVEGVTNQAEAAQKIQKESHDNSCSLHSDSDSSCPRLPVQIYLKVHVEKAPLATWASSPHAVVCRRLGNSV